MFLPVVLCDLDAAFLGFELLRRPELKGHPVIIGGRPEQRGVVATCSYEARAFGVRSAMSAAEAVRRCPQARLLPVDMPYYRDLSSRFRQAATRGVAVFEPVGLDEVYLDLRGQEKQYPDTQALCQDLQRRIREELGLACSVGASTGRALAKLACEILAKPGRIALLPAAAAAEVLAAQPVERLPGVGAATATMLRRHGVCTCGDLATASDDAVAHWFGARGARVRDVARGIDHSAVIPPGPPKALSVDETFARDLSAPADIRLALLRLSWLLGERLAAEGVSVREVGVRWRTPDFRDGSAQRTLSAPITARTDLRDVALAVWAERGTSRPVRLLSIHAGRLERRRGCLLPQDRLEAAVAQIEAAGQRLLPASLLDWPRERAGRAEVAGEGLPRTPAAGWPGSAGVHCRAER